MERQEHQQEREQAFLSQNRDCFAIYQVSCDDPQNMRFMNLDWLKSHDISIDRSNYDLIYTAPLSESGTVPEQLEKLYQQFNLEKPVDFHSPSMSVSDIMEVKSFRDNFAELTERTMAELDKFDVKYCVEWQISSCTSS